MSKVARVVIAALALSACTAETPTSLARVPDLDRGGSHGHDPLPAPSRTVVMSGLENPRGLAWGPDGSLYVAEAGTNVTTGPCVALPRGANCYSGTGAVTRLSHGKQQRVASGLPSAYNPATSDVGGPHDISFGGHQHAQVTIGWGGPPASRAGFGAAGSSFGTVISLKPKGTWKVVADIAAFEGTTNPGGGALESNPYGILTDRHGTYVTDAGGNSLLRLSHDGTVSLVATFPATAVPPGPPFNPPFAQSDAVPTDVTRGPDGALYVSTLTGAPFLPGVARIYRVVPGEAPQVYAAGFTQIIDFDWASDGSLLVLQYASAPFFGGPGSVIRVDRNGARTTIATGLTHPTSVLAGPHGSIYVSNNGTVVGMGEVLRIVP